MLNQCGFGRKEFKMTEEERQKTILELEQEVLGYKSKSQPRVCEVCGNKLIKGECEDHQEDCCGC